MTETQSGQTIDSKFQTTIAASDNAPASKNVGVVNASYIEFNVSASCLVTPVTITVNTDYGTL